MKNFLIWLMWKLFVSIEFFTCNYIKRSIRFSAYCDYKNFLAKNGAIASGDPYSLHIKVLKDTHPQSYKQMRRDFMWRFLVRGER